MSNERVNEAAARLLNSFTPAVVAPKRPAFPGWRRLRVAVDELERRGYPYEVWAHDGNGLGVITAIEVAAEAEGMPPLGPAYHISVSAFGKRCSSADAAWVLAQFECSDALEDNHVPNGQVRNFWRYVADNLAGRVCACVDVEPEIREDKGDYVWRGA